MAILSNTPTVRYITVQGMVITDSGVLYPITSFETCDKYVYWNKSTPFQLYSSNNLENTNDIYLIVLNKFGTPTLVSQTNITVSFSNEIINNNSSEINGIIEKVDQNTTKIASVVKDVNGLSSSVATVKEDINLTNEKVSNLQQTSDRISMEVSNITTSYNDDKEFNLLKENITSEMINEHSILGELLSIIREISKDNVLSVDEKKETNDKRTEITVIHNKLLGYIDNLISALNEQGLTEHKNKLTKAKSDFVTSYTNVNSIIDTIFTANVITPTQITTIVNGIYLTTTKLTKLKDVCNEVLFLGTGGVVYEELAKINITSSSIQQTVSSIKESIQSNLSLEKGKLQTQIEDLNVANDKLDVIIKESYIDGTVTDVEKSLINDKIASVDSEIADITKIYNGYLNSIYISNSVKIAMQNSYTRFTTLYNNFKTELISIISDGFFNETEKNTIDVKFKEFKEYIPTFHNSIVLAIDDCENNRYIKELNDAKSALQGQIDKLEGDIINVDNTINTTFKDNVIDEMERSKIAQNVLDLNLDKVSVDNQYTQLYKNTLLVNPLKSEFKNTYDLLNTSYANLLSILNGILAKETLVTQQDKINIDNGYKELTSKTPNYVTVANKVIEFISNAEAEQSRNQFESAVGNLQGQIDKIDGDMGGAFTDNLLDKAERELIKSKLESVNLSKSNIDAQYNSLYNSIHLTDLTLKSELKTKYDGFIVAYNSFSTIITTLVNKVEIITQEEKTQLNNSMSMLNLEIKEFTNTSIKVNDHIYVNQANNMISDVNITIANLEGKVDNVVSTVTDAVKDSVLDDTERMAVEQAMFNLESQKVSLDNQYTQVYSNVNLNAAQKLSLKTSKDSFDVKYTSLIASINNILNKVGNITQEDRVAYENAYNLYKTQLATLTQSLATANNQIYEKMTNDAKTNLETQIGQVESSLGDLSNFMNGAFHDGILDATERVSLRNNLETLKLKKVDVDNEFTQINKNTNLTASVKTKLNTDYNNYVTKYQELVNFIDSLLASEGKVNELHKTQLTTLLTNHNKALATYVVQYNVAIEDISKNYTDATKNVLQGQISNVNNSVGDLENTMNGVFQDGVLSSAEKLAIKERLQILQSEKVNIDKQYETLIANKDLVDVNATEKAKTNLTNAYTDLNKAYTSIVNAIDTFVKIVGIVDENHRVPVANAFNEYKVKSGVYSTRVNEAVDAISKKRINDEAQIREEKIVQLTQDLNGFKLSVSQTYSKITDVENVKKDLSQLNVNVGEISQKVSSVETITSNLDQEISKVSNRVETAESKLTKNGLTTIIGNTYTTSSEVEGQIVEKGYATKTEMNTTATNIEMKFTRSGGYNLFKNSLYANKNTDSWWFWGKADRWIRDMSYYSSPGDMWIYNSSSTEAGGLWQTLDYTMKPNTKYTLNVLVDKEVNVKSSYFKIEYFADSADALLSSQVINLIFDAERHSYTFTTPNDNRFKYVKCGFYHGGSTSTVGGYLVRINKPCLCEGDSAVWSMNPSEVRGGITTVDDSGLKIEMIEGSSSKGHTKIEYDGFSIHNSKGERTAWFGSDDSAYIDTLKVNKIIEPTLIKWSRDRALDFYISTTSTGDGTGKDRNNKSNNVNNLLTWITREYGCYSYCKDINIHFDNGVYLQDIYIGGWLGSGCITIHMGSDVELYGQFRIEENVPPLCIDGGRTGWVTNDGARIYHNDPFYVRSSNVMIKNLRCKSAERHKGTFITGVNNSHINCENCDIVNYHNVIGGLYSYFHFSDVRGVVTYISAAMNQTYIFWQASTPVLLTGKWQNNWNSNVSISDIQTNSVWYPYTPDTPPPPPPPSSNWRWTEQTFALQNLRTIPEGSGTTTSGKGGMWGQGNYESYKNHRGYADIVGAKDWCSGGRNFSATMTLKRWATKHGQYGEVPVPVINGWNTGVGIALGQAKTVTIPSWLVSEIVNGNITTLNMWNTGSSNYSFYDFSSITIKCEKNFI